LQLVQFIAERFSEGRLRCDWMFC